MNKSRKSTIQNNITIMKNDSRRFVPIESVNNSEEEHYDENRSYLQSDPKRRKQSSPRINFLYSNAVLLFIH